MSFGYEAKRLAAHVSAGSATWLSGLQRSISRAVRVERSPKPSSLRNGCSSNGRYSNKPKPKHDLERAAPPASTIACPIFQGRLHGQAHEQVSVQNNMTVSGCRCCTADGAAFISKGRGGSVSLTGVVSASFQRGRSGLPFAAFLRASACSVSGVLADGVAADGDVSEGVPAELLGLGPGMDGDGIALFFGIRVSSLSERSMRPESHFTAQVSPES